MMSFLTTNFIDTDITSEFTGPFRLIDLPLELLLKVFIFLDDPDLKSVGYTCKYLRSVANERFIIRSKFFYIQQKIGIALSLRPTRKYLSEHNILPNTSPSAHTTFNVNHFLLVNSLQKSFKQESLNKKLSQRPSKMELKRINILPESEKSDLVKFKVKELQKNNISDMLDTFLKTCKLQEETRVLCLTNHRITRDSESDITQLPRNVDNKSDHQQAGFEGDTAEQSHDSDSDDSAQLDIDSASSRSVIQRRRTIVHPIEASDDFTEVYLDFVQRIHKNSASSSRLHQKQSIRHVLNHIDINHKFLLNNQKFLDNHNRAQLEKIKQLSNVKLRKEYFENLGNGIRDVSSPSSSPKKLSVSPSRSVSSNSSGIVFSDIARQSGSLAPQRPSRTVLKASVIDDSIITYEKMY